MLYLLAYKPILQILEARRQQIASGLANADKIKAELARIDAERLDVLAKADAEGKQLIEEARAAAARVGAAETTEGAQLPPNRSSSGPGKLPIATTRGCSRSSDGRSAGSSCRRPRRSRARSSHPRIIAACPKRPPDN